METKFKGLNLEQIEYLLDFITSPYYQPNIVKELKIKLRANQEILDSYHNTDDLYFCEENRQAIRIITSILEVLGVE